MKEERNRGPDPDFSDDGGLLRRIIREELHAREPVELTYNEGYRDLTMLCQILKWAAGIASTLAVSGIIGAIVMYGNVQALREEVASLRHDFDDFRKLVEPKYRGGDDGNANSS